MKRLSALILAFVMCFAFAGIATAENEFEGEARVVMGANLDDEQRAKIYRDFGIEEGSVRELSVTNSEEREYLEGLVPDRKIGSVSLSCIYITILAEGEGISVETHDIDWCTKEMYVNALTTAGITDARVIVSAPFDVSGTAALTGVYKAYEDIYGEDLDELAKQIGAQELVITAEISDFIGGTDAAELVTELKKILTETATMTDDEVREQIRSISANMNISLSEDNVERLLGLCRTLEKLGPEELEAKVKQVQDAITGVNEAREKVATFTKKVAEVGDKISVFFTNVGNAIGGFFAGIFGSK